MHIGILVGGKIGSSLGRLWIANGHDVCFGFVRNEARLRDLGASVGPHAHVGTAEEVAQFGEAVLLAVPWTPEGNA